jgi:hypothetical protein
MSDDISEIIEWHKQQAENRRPKGDVMMSGLRCPPPPISPVSQKRIDMHERFAAALATAEAENARLREDHLSLLGPGIAADYHDRHGTPALNVLTITSEDEARRAVEPWIDEIAGKRVIEVGSGIGLLSLEMAKHAATVIAIEADVAWSWVFVKHLYQHKPPNLSWWFGNADQATPFVRGDIAVIRSYSGLRRMIAVADQMCPRVLLSFDEGWQVANRGDPILNGIATAQDAFQRERISNLSAKEAP